MLGVFVGYHAPMMLAPMPQLSGKVIYLPEGLNGVRRTLVYMRELVKQGRVDPLIRQAATQAIFLTPEKDEYSEANAIFDMVRDSIRYVKDVNQVETLSTPQITLAGRLGDCDDQTVLLAALLESVGYPTRFVVAGYSDPNAYDHVYLQACVNNQWIDMDATEKQVMGWSPPNPVALAYETV